MSIYKTFKYRIYPTAGQVTLLNRQLELCRWIYNTTLSARQVAWEEYHETLSYFDTSRLLTHWKLEKPELRQVHSQVLQDVQRRVDLAYAAFFRRVKNGGAPGFPHHKSLGCYDSLTYTRQATKRNLANGKTYTSPVFELFSKNNHKTRQVLYVSKIGDLEIVLHRPIPYPVKTLTLIRNACKKWFACFVVEAENEHLSAEGQAAGFDLGLKTYVVGSDGFKVDAPRFFEMDRMVLAKAQRRLSRRQKGTAEYEEARQIVARIHERIHNRRDNFCHQVSREIVNRYHYIVFERLNVSRMTQQEWWADKITDAAWSQLMRYTKAKADVAGRQCVFVDPTNTSQVCSGCGEFVQKDLSVRIHECPHCGIVIDRDLNAARNILALGLQSMGSQSLEATETELESED